ncbi:phage terminase small subunit [Halalkalibacter oceani]|uniref:phage terminase small subunit n=1 Tax=Halalkalibacter oceani TaxID=1653776 RepID=UPI003392A0EC
MPRPRDPRRDEAKEAWLKSNGEAKLKDIAAYLGVTSSTVRKWKATDKWEEELKGSAPIPKRSAPKRGSPGAPKGNKNAEGNAGGPPSGNKNALGNSGGAAPIGNKNALVTGEYESILFDTLTDEEQVLFEMIDTSPLSQIEEDIRILSIRERRMMQRIRAIVEGLTESEKRVLKERITEKVPVETYNERTGKVEIKTVKKEQLIVTEEEETTYRKIDDILKIEEALTRIQGKKHAAIKLKHEMEERLKLDDIINKRKLEEEKLKAETEFVKARTELIKGSKKDTSLLEALIAAKKGDDE